MEKLIFFITGLDIGGAETQLYRICKHIDKSNIDIKVVSLTGDGAIGEKIREENIEVISFDIKKNKYKEVINIFKLVKKEKPDVIIGFLFHAIIISRIIGYLNSVPNIISSIRSFNTGGIFRETLIKITDFMSNMTIVNSSIVYEKVLKKKLVKKGKLKVIRNGIDIEQFKFDETYRREWRKKNKIDDNTFVWMAVGRLVYEKDYVSMIKAFKRVLEKDKNNILYIIGDGYMKSEIEALIIKYDLTNNIFMKSNCTEINKLLSAGDGVILTSKWEGIPNTIIEAMALDRIVVATDVGGVSEVVKDSGILVESENITSIANGMLDGKKRWGNSTKLEARKIIEEDYEVKNIVKKWEEIIKIDYKK